MNIKKILEELKNLKDIKNMYNLLVVFLVGVLIVIVSSFFKDNNLASVSTMAGKEQDESITVGELRNYEQAQENKLKYMLSQMQGVGRVEVLITYEDEGEVVPAVNINGGSSAIKEKDNQGGERITNQDNKGSSVVITNEGNNTKALILKKYYPKIKGVMVVAEGAEDKQVQYDILKVVSETFSVPKNKVNVYPMKR